MVIEESLEELLYSFFFFFLFRKLVGGVRQAGALTSCLGQTVLSSKAKCLRLHEKLERGVAVSYVVCIREDDVIVLNIVIESC